MKTILISYDLRAPHKDYEKLWEHLKSYGSWAKPLESFWLVKTDKSAEQVRNVIRDSYVDSNDKIFVVDVTSRESAWNNLVEEVSNWIKENL